VRQFAVRALSVSILPATQTVAAQTIGLMTQNLDVGTSQGYLLALPNSKPKLGVDLTFTEIVARDISRRTNDFAARIATERPDPLGSRRWAYGGLVLRPRLTISCCTIN
jgi:hypothetical protein